MMLFPQNAALKLLAAKDEAGQQAALLEGQFFVNAEPVTIWLNGQGPQADLKPSIPDTPAENGSAKPVAAEIVDGTDGHGPAANVVPSFRNAPSR